MLFNRVINLILIGGSIQTFQRSELFLYMYYVRVSCLMDMEDTSTS